MKQKINIYTLLTLCVIYIFAAVQANAATYTVTTNADSGAGSLRQAVLDANATSANDVIVFNIPAANCNATSGVCTITLNSEIVIASNGSLTINGTGANRLTISGNNNSRLFFLNSVTFTLSGATLTGGNGAGSSPSGYGGAIYAESGTIVLRGVNITGNTASGSGNIGGVYLGGGANHQIVNSTISNNAGLYRCGGFFNANGSLTVTNTTISGNTATNSGGGFCNSGTMNLRSSTVTGNSVPDFGGGIYVFGTFAQLTVSNSIAAGNSGNRPDIFNDNSSVMTAGYNLIGNNTGAETQFPAGNPNANKDIVGTSAATINAQLAPLGNYGGTVPARALCTAANVPDVSCTGASPAIDKGSAGVSSDGRGVIRPYDIFTTANAASGNGADIGAFELIPTFAFGWGENTYGQVGDTTTTHRSLPTQIAGGYTDIVSIEGAIFHTLALRSNGTLLAWGYNIKGQVGDGTTTQRNSPVVVAGLTNVIAVASGGSHSLALLSDGTIRAWGANDYGQIGDGTTTDRLTSVAVIGITSANPAVAIAGGGNSSYALLADGSVKAWGYNLSGQLGDGTKTNRLTPVQVTNLTGGVIAINGGRTGGYALLSNGSVRAWGYNQYGELGDGTTNERLTPITPIGLTSGVLQIEGGDENAFALKSDGTLLSWGRNFFGELGNGTRNDTSVPAAIDLSNVVQIKSSFGKDIYARLRDGSLYAWGYNGYGSVGNGTTATAQTTPVRSSTDTGSGFFGASRSTGYAVTPLVPVAAGANQFIRMGDATVSFANVLTAGTMQMRSFDPTASGLNIPTGYTIVANSPGYDINSTAAFTGTAQVCLKADTVVNPSEFSRLYILHDDDGDGTLDALPMTYNYQKREVCRQTNSFSPFVLAQSLAPTAASVAISGRVSVGKSAGLSNAFVTLTDSDGVTRTTPTNSFGYYHFEDVEIGQSYTMTVQSKRYYFAPRVVTVSDELVNLDFTAY